MNVVPFPRVARTGGRRKGPGTQPPTLLKIQPEPVVTRVVHFPLDTGDTITSIARTWANGDEKLCRLCERCKAYDGGCLKTVGRYVSREDAPLFSNVEFKRAKEAVAERVRLAE